MPVRIVKRLSDAGASTQELSQFETMIGARLPPDYRQFMSELNGGSPEPSKFSFNTADRRETSSVRYFLTLDKREKRYTIQNFLERLKGRIPKKTLPIASDEFGNFVLLDVGAKSVGAVCFWDHEEENDDEDDDEPNWDNITVVAPSFTEFLNILE